MTATPTTDWINNAIHPINADTRKAALSRQAQLTKPPGSLCQLEEVAVQLSAMQATTQPLANNVSITIFVADHGIAAEGTSAFPQAVTGEMVKNFATGGAAISVMARQLNADLEVVNLGCINDPGELPGVINYSLGTGTANACKQAAMTQQQLHDALNAGHESVQRALQNKRELFIGGDMGIGNTASATAIICVLLNQSATVVTGPGTGLDSAGVIHKAKIIQSAIDFHRPHINNPMETLRHLGGFEIAALTGAYIACAQAGLPIVVDGFIASSAALIAVKYSPTVRDWMIFGHQSAEPGHRLVLDQLDAKPLLNLGLRLGEGSGAAAAVPLIRLACALHNEMATFAEAGVSDAH